MNNQQLIEPEELKRLRQKQMRDQIIGPKFNEQYAKLLETQVFPSDDLGSEKDNGSWITWAKFALRFTSPMSLGIYGKAFNDLIHISPYNINLLQFSLLNNNLERCSADQLGVLMETYGELVIMTGKLAEKWDALVKDMRAELEKKLNKEFDEMEKQANRKKNNLPVFKNPPPPPVKAEA